jgi:hypothetical protein
MASAVECGKPPPLKSEPAVRGSARKFLAFWRSRQLLMRQLRHELGRVQASATEEAVSSEAMSKLIEWLTTSRLTLIRGTGARRNHTRFKRMQVVSNLRRRLPSACCAAHDGGTDETHDSDIRSGNQNCQSGTSLRAALVLGPWGCPGRADRKEGHHPLT